LISIIIPSYNPGKNIINLIESLLSQDCGDKYEIVVVDSSTDNTRDIISKYPIKVFFQKPSGAAAARNVGIKKSKGDIIVFIDSDCIAPKTWLKNLLEPFKDSGVFGVAGTYRNKNNSSISKFIQYEIEYRHEKMVDKKEIDFVGTYNCAYRRDVFDSVGYFDEKLTQAEDADFSFRASKEFKIVFNKTAYVYHDHVSDMFGFIKQKFQRGFWKPILYSRNKSKLVGDSYTPKTLGLQVLLTGLLLVSFFMINYLYSIVILFFIYFLNMDLFRFLLKNDKQLLVMSLMLILIRNTSAGFGVVFGLFYLIVGMNKKHI
jgi:cellulose synthase/poly-beta-1,6-N-acetylglucosamine synthase-like glycosyltransferase